MSLKRNIPLMYAIGALSWSRFFLPVLALFYVANNVSIEQFGIILGVFSLTIFALEIPTGVLSDFIGRRNTLLLSKLCYVIEVIIFCFFDGFWPFLIAKIISGIGVSLGSGTNEALLFETLKKIGREKEHRKVFGHLQFISNISMAAIFIIGAYLFSLNVKYPAYFSVPFISLAFILTFFLKEPYVEKMNVSVKQTMVHFLEGTRLFFKNKEFILINLFSVPIIFVFNIVTSLSSEYFRQILIPISLIGIVSCTGSLLYAYAAKREHALEDRIGSKNMIIFIISANALSLLLMTLMIPYVGAVAYIIIPFVGGFSSVFVNHYMNVRVSETHRATMLSVRSMFDNIGVFIVFPIAGLLAEKSLPYTYIFLGMLLMVFFGGLIFFRIKHRLLQ